MKKNLILTTALFAGTMLISNDICAGNEFNFVSSEYYYAKILFNLRKNAQPNGYQRTQDQHEQSEVNDQQGQRTHKRIRKRTRAQMMGSNDLQKEGTLKRTHDKSSDDQEIIDITLSDDQEIIDITSSHNDQEIIDITSSNNDQEIIDIASSDEELTCDCSSDEKDYKRQELLNDVYHAPN